MKKVQKIIIIIYLILVAIACIYVPWRTRVFPGGSMTTSITVSIGYSPFWNPAKAYFSKTSIFSTIDYGKIALEVIALAAIFGVLFLLTLGHEKD
jgi:hypothetical protein